MGLQGCGNRGSTQTAHGLLSLSKTFRPTLRKKGTHMSRFLSSMAICILGFGLSVSAQTTKTPSDNTKVNQRDKNNANPTADQQKENAADREITRKIRRS